MIDIKIHEPSLTGDNLGHKTWVASYLLAKRLPYLFRSKMEEVKQEERGRSTSCSPLAAASESDLRPRVLELGTGTGLVGLAASALFPMNAYLTDLDSIVSNLQRNVAENVCIAERSNSIVNVGPLDWSATHPNLPEEKRYHFILAADSLYAPQHAQWLVSTMDAYLTKDPLIGQVFAEFPLRTTEPVEHRQFRSEMKSHSFWLDEEGEEVGFDDWEGSRPGDRVEVRCWWSVWRRRQDLE